MKWKRGDKVKVTIGEHMMAGEIVAFATTCRDEEGAIVRLGKARTGGIGGPKAKPVCKKTIALNRLVPA